MLIKATIEKIQNELVYSGHSAIVRISSIYDELDGMIDRMEINKIINQRVFSLELRRSGDNAVYITPDKAESEGEDKGENE